MDVIVETADERRARFGLTEPAEALLRHALDMRETGQFVTAVVAARRAVKMCPSAAQAQNVLGSALWNLGKFAEAMVAYDRALAIDCDDASIHGNRAMALSSLHEHAEADASYRRAVDLEPDNLNIRWDRSISQLCAGDWKRGLDAYDIRLPLRGSMRYPKMPYTTWDGEDLAGKTLFVHAEQGIGDRILFSRYLGWVLDRWPTAKVEIAIADRDMPTLDTLFWEAHPRLRTIPAGAWFPKADFGIYMGSLPRIHGSTPDNVPSDPGWISARARRDGENVVIPEPKVPAIRVGVCWAGSPRMNKNHERSVPLELMMELEEIETVQLYGIQFAPGHADIARLNAGEMIYDLAPSIEPKGLCGTAAVMTNLDLVISACTANLHLAGAVGVPTWGLLCYDPYWVWLRDGTESVWYPSMRLFRQPEPGDWRSVIDEVKMVLAQYSVELLART